MDIPGFFIRRPRFAVALSVLPLLAAALAWPLVPVALYPPAARPAISVSCTYPGANAREVMNTVAGPIEEQVNGVEGMSRMSSSCSDSGSYSLTVYFRIGIDRDMALTKVQSKVQQALPLLPQEVKNTGVTVQTGSSEELGILTLRSKNGELTREQVVDYAYGVVNPAILRVPGVGKSTVKDDKIAMRIWLDAKRLASLGINTEEVIAAIKAQNVQASLGSVGASPTDDPAARVISLISKGRLDTEEDFANIVVRTASDGGLVRLGDVARIDLGQQGYSFAALYDETPAVYILIHQLPGIDVLKATAAIKEELRRLESAFPGDLTWDMTYDTTRYVRAALGSAAAALGFAFLAAILAVFAFLRSFRATVLVAVSSLVALAAAFAVLAFAGFFVSLISLYAFILALALGVVFPSLVLWKIRARFRAGVEIHAAAAEAVASLASDVPAAAGAVVLALVPLAFVDGVPGVVYRQFSLVLGVAAAVAAFVSLALVPALASRIYSAADRKGADGASAPRPAVAVPSAALAVFVAACAFVSWRLFATLPQEFIPDEDMGVIIVDAKLAEGTSMPITSEVMRQVYRKARALGGVEKSVTLLGESIVSGSGENNAKTYLILDDWSVRDRTAAELTRAIQAAEADVPEAQVFTLRPPPMPGQGNQSGLTVLIQSMEDADPVRFAHEAQRLRAAFELSPLVESSSCGTVANVPHLRVCVDREKCELLKVPMSSLYTTLQHCLGSSYVNDINLGTQVNRVTVMADFAGRATREDVSELYVRSQAGEMVPVDTLVTFREELGIRDCYRCNKYLYCTVQFVPKPGVSMSEAIDEVRRISAATLPRGYVQDWSGLVYERFQSRGDTPVLVVLAFLLLYLVLVVRFESLRRSFRYLLPSVFAVLGALILHAATGVPLSLYSQFALLLLAFLATAYAVLTASLGRRPRLFAALVSAAVALPLACATGAGSAGSRSLGVTLVGGFVLTAVLSFLGPSSPVRVKSPGKML